MHRKIGLLAVALLMPLLPLNGRNTIPRFTEYKVRATGGLNIRSNPSLQGRRIATIPNRSTVLVLEKQGRRLTIGGRSGYWARIRWNNRSGWAFSAFLVQVTGTMGSTTLLKYLKRRYVGTTYGGHVKFADGLQSNGGGLIHGKFFLSLLVCNGQGVYFLEETIGRIGPGGKHALFRIRDVVVVEKGVDRYGLLMETGHQLIINGKPVPWNSVQSRGLVVATRKNSSRVLQGWRSDTQRGRFVPLKTAGRKMTVKFRTFGH